MRRSRRPRRRQRLCWSRRPSARLAPMKTKAPSALRKFVMLHPEVEAVLQRCGLATWDLVLVDVNGTWTRGVFPSDTVAEAVCADLGIRMHSGWEEDPRMTRRINALDAWSTRGAKRRAL